MEKSVRAFGAAAAGASVTEMQITRRAPTDHDVAIRILYSGICHSDLHGVNNDWGFSQYPLIPGHEIVGQVTAIGNAVTKYNIGDIVGVGCFVDACRHCEACKDHQEQYCDNFVLTYNSEDPKHGGTTYGGYSDDIVVDEDFVLKVPQSLDVKRVAPLLCAGITTYSPIKHWQVKQGDTVGVIGLGGLGHMGIKFAKAMGAHVVMITSSPDKAKDATLLGADESLISTDAAQMTAAQSQFDFLLNTIPVKHDLNPYLALLKRDKTMVIVGAVEPFGDGELNGMNLIFKRKCIAGSLVGGLQETQEMLDFCGEHNILPEVEMIKPTEINDAFTRMQKHDVKYRFVIDFEHNR